MEQQETFTVFSRISRLKLRALINAALDEDIGSGDITSKLLIPQELQANAKVLYELAYGRYWLTLHVAHWAGSLSVGCTELSRL